TGFRKRSCSNNKLKRDDDSKKSHHALEPRWRHAQRSPAHGPSGGVTPALAVVRPGREGDLAFGTRERNGSKAETYVAGRGIELGDLTKRTLRRKYPRLHIRGGGQVVDVELDPADDEAPTGQRRERRPGRLDALLAGRDEVDIGGRAVGVEYVRFHDDQGIGGRGLAANRQGREGERSPLAGRPRPRRGGA